MTPADLDRIRAQYTGAHRCDPPGSVAADVRALLDALDTERARLDTVVQRARDEARRAAIEECVAAVKAITHVDVVPAAVRLRALLDGPVRPDPARPSEEP